MSTTELTSQVNALNPHAIMIHVHSLSEDNVSVNIRRLLTEAVRKRMMGSRRIGCMLSGRVDMHILLVRKLVHPKGYGKLKDRHRRFGSNSR